MGNLIQRAGELERDIINDSVIKEAAMLKEQEEKDAMYIAMDEAKKNRKLKFEAFVDYKSNVKKKLLTEVLKRIYIGSIKNPTDNEKNLCESFIGNYVNEQGADNLLIDFKGKTMFLDNLYETVIKHYTKITEDADADDKSSMALTDNNLNDFFKELDKTEDIEDMTNTIRLRVANAEEDFVNQNQKDKENLKSIIADTSARINSSKEGNDNDYEEEVPTSEEDEEIKQEAVISAKRKIAESSRTKINVFEQMVRNIASITVSDTQLYEQYGTDNGRVDIDKVVESARCMYTMLEMISTLKIENVDSQYIKETLDSIC